jgi:hypothetical protein
VANGNRAIGGPSVRLHPFTRTLLFVFVAALLAASLLCLTVGTLPPSELKARLDAMAPDGVADDFSLARVAAMRHMAFFAVALALLMAAGVWVVRRPIDAGCREAGNALRSATAWVVEEGRPIAPQLTAVTALGCLLRAAFLTQSMRVDEATTYLEFVSKPLLYGLSYYPAPNNHILHTVLAHLATLLFGGEPWAVRLAAFLAGTLMIPAAALAAIALKGRNAALPAACLIAVSWPWVFYSANARGYTLVGLVFLLLIPICVRLRTAPDRGAWLWFVVLAGLGLWAVPVMAYALVPLGLWVACSRRGAWRELAAAAGCTIVFTLLLYAPALTASGFTAARTPEMTPEAGLAPWSRIAEFAGELLNNWRHDLPVWVLAALLLAAGIGWRSGALAAISSAWLVAALALYPVMPYVRVWLWLSLPWLLLIACGLGAVLPRRRITDLLLVALVAWQAGRIVASGSIPRSRETGAFPDAGAAAGFLKQHWQPGDGLATGGVPSPLLYELRRQGLPSPAKSPARRWVVADRPPPGAAAPLVHLIESSIWLLVEPRGPQ